MAGTQKRYGGKVSDQQTALSFGKKEHQASPIKGPTQHSLVTNHNDSAETDCATAAHNLHNS